MPSNSFPLWFREEAAFNNARLPATLLISSREASFLKRSGLPLKNQLSGAEIAVLECAEIFCYRKAGHMEAPK
jgi:hypothetical protein